MFERVPLAEVADLAMGETIIAEDCDGRGLPIYSAATNDTPWNHSTRFIRKLKKGTIVVGARGSIGFPRMPTDDLFGATQTTITVVAKGDSVRPRFLFHVLRGIDFKTLTSQQAIPMLTVAEFGGVSLPRPPVREQGKVVEILDTLDTAIRQTEAIIEKLKQAKQGLLHDLLTRGIDANGGLRPPQSEAPHLYTDSPLGWIPTEWRPADLGSLIDGAPRNGIYKAPGDIGTGALLVGQNAFTSEGSVDFTLARRARITSEEREVFGLVRNDLLVARVFATREGVGQPVIVPALMEPAVFESNMMRLRIRPGTMEAPLVFHWLKGRVARAWITARAFASNQASINRETLCSVPVALPPPGEQGPILEVVRAHEERERNEARVLAKLQRIKSGLMDDLLTGRVRVTSLLDLAVCA